jgi:hypothetical protein
MGYNTPCLGCVREPMRDAARACMRCSRYKSESRDLYVPAFNLPDHGLATAIVAYMLAATSGTTSRLSIKEMEDGVRRLLATQAMQKRH